MSFIDLFAPLILPTFTHMNPFKLERDNIFEDNNNSDISLFLKTIHRTYYFISIY